MEKLLTSLGYTHFGLLKSLPEGEPFSHFPSETII
jgi:hypothetical protein